MASMASETIPAADTAAETPSAVPDTVAVEVTGTSEPELETVASEPQEAELVSQAEVTPENDIAKECAGTDAHADDDAAADTGSAAQQGGASEDAQPKMPSGPGLYEDFQESEIKIQLGDPNNPLQSATKFEDLKLPDELLRALYLMGYRKPSKIQEKALPLLLRDPPTNMIAQSQSGTGKTAAFVLCMLARSDPNVPKVQALCLANTRELALQIASNAANMACNTTLNVALAVPTGPRGSETRTDIPNFNPKNPTAQVVVGTPGSVYNALRVNPRAFSHLRVFVLDEADVMLGAGSLSDTCLRIRHQVDISLQKSSTQKIQYLLFSATFSDQVTEFANRFAPYGNKIMLQREEVKVSAIRQFMQTVPLQQASQGSRDSYLKAKLAKLADIYGLLTVSQSIVFVQRRETAVTVGKYMETVGHHVGTITGDDLPAVRDRTMDLFRSGKVKVLVATNVLARGIDVPQVNLVVNFDLATDQHGHPDCEGYLHRIGRTGRFGRQGVAINFVSTETEKLILQEYAKKYGVKIEEMPSLYDEMEKLLEKIKI